MIDRRIRITAAALLAACSVAGAASMTWTGGSGNWSVGANWSGGLVPTNGDDVTLGSSAAARLTVVDVQGRVYHASTGANLPAGGSIPDSNAQMYMILADLPMINIVYTNMKNMGEGLSTLSAVSSRRWRGNPNDAYRTINTGAADYALFANKYQIRDNGPNTNMHDNRTKKENDSPTPQVTFDMPDLNGLYTVTGPKVYIAHDTATARPSWLTTDFTDTGKHLATDGENPTWDVFEREITTFTPATGDSRGWISDGAALAGLVIQQTHAGVTQTVRLAHNLSVTGAPTFAVSAGAVVLDVGAYKLRTTSDITIPAGVTVTLAGGEFGKAEGDVSLGGLTIQAGGTLAGTGLVSPGRGDYLIAEGGTLQVGAGMLSLGLPFGEVFRWDGAIVGNGATSVLNLASGLSNGQLKKIAQVGPNASISGIVELRMAPIFPVQPAATFSFGRFADPARIQIGQMTLTSTESTQFLWEAQTTALDVFNNPANPAFKLGAWKATGGADLKLLDTGTVADDFAYIGRLVGLSSSQRLDLNDIPLLTDMTAVELAAILAFVDNTGVLGPAQVKTVQIGQGDYWYLAPEGASIQPPVTEAEIPEPGCSLLLAAGLAALSARRKRG